MARTHNVRRRRPKAGAKNSKPTSMPPGFREDAMPFVATLLDPNGVIAVERVADAFCLTKFQLADILGLAREPAPKTQARLREMLEIISLVEEWAGGKLQAMAWYRAQAIPEFGGRTAESLVKSGDASAVRDYIDHIAMGGFA